MTNKNLVKPDVISKLGSLKSTLKGRLFGEGFAWALLALAGAIVVTFALDFLLNLPVPLRIVFMVLAVGGLVYVLWIRLLSPLFVPMETESLALLVEKHFDQLGDRFISALQFSNVDSHALSGMSPAMVDRVAQEANTMVQPLAFNSIVEFKHMFKMIITAGLVVLVLGGLGVWQSNLFGIWFERNVLLRQTPWPQDTYLEVGEFVNTSEPGQPPVEKFNKRHDFKCHRGEDLRVIIRAGNGPSGQISTVNPGQITIYTRYAQVGITEERISPMGGRDGYFEKVFRSVSEEFEFYVTCDGDKLDKANPHKVTLLETAELQSINYHVESPKYMNLRDSFQDIDTNSDVLPVPAGGIVHFDGISSKALSKCHIYINGWKVEAVIGKADVIKLPADPKERKRVIEKAQKEGDIALLEGRKFAGYFKVSAFNLPSYEKVISDNIYLPGGIDGFSALMDAVAGSTTALAATTRGQAERLELSIVLVDDEGFSRIAGSRQIKLKPDNAPEFREFNAIGVSAQVSPKAMLNMRMEIADDYGLEWIKLMVGINDEPMKPLMKEGEVVLIKPEHVGKNVFSNIGKEQENVVLLAQLGVKPGDRVRIQAIAVDTMPGDYGGPNKAFSVVREFQVIEMNDLTVILLAPLEDLFGMFTECISNQNKARATSETLAGVISNSNEITDEILMELNEDKGKQNSVNSMAISIAERLSRIVQEMEYNQLSTAKQLSDYRTKIVDRILRGDFTEDINGCIEKLEDAVKIDESELLEQELLTIALDQEQLAIKLVEMQKALEGENEIQRQIILVSGMKKTFEDMKKTLIDIINKSWGDGE